MALVTINGKEIQVDDGKLILDAARESGFEIPTFCYHAKLKQLGSCRMCLVQIDGMRKLQPSCVTPVMDGMKVFTESPTVIAARKAQMEFLLINHPLDCPVCDQAGECELQDHAFKFGGTSGRFRWKKRTFEKRDMGPSVEKEMNRCIACRRCSRYCDEISGDYAISELNRGNELEMGSFCHTPIESEFIGNTAQICPVGALTSKPFKFMARSWDLIGTETICPHCSVGCSITSERKYVDQAATQMLQTKSIGSTPALDETESRILRNMATEDKGATEISLCDRGRYGHRFINSDKRLKSPMIRENGKLVETSWDKALGFVADRLSEIKDKKGADAVAGVTSGICSNEDGYLFQKFMRETVGSSNVALSAVGGLDRAAAVRLSSMRGELKSIKDADLVLVLGSSVASDTPIASMHAGIAARSGGAKLIMITAGENRLLTSPQQRLSYRKGAESALVAALAMAAQGSLKGAEAEKMLAAAGIDQADIESVKKSLSGAKKGVILFGNDIAGGPDASSSIEALYALAEEVGFNGKNGRVIYAPPVGNMVGSLDMGLLSDSLPGYKKAAKAGMDWPAMIESASAGKLKAMYLMADNPVATAFERAAVVSAFEKLDLLIVQDLFLTETASVADVVLPAASYAENTGTVTNLEGRVQKLNRSIAPLGDSREDWRILVNLSEKMGGHLRYASASDITDEISKNVAGYEKINLDNIARDGHFADLEKLDQPKCGKVVAKVAGDSSGGADFPLFIVPGKDVLLGSSLSWMDESLLKISSGPRAHLSQRDALNLGISDGDAITVESSGGAVETKAHVTAKVSDGFVVLPANHPDFDVRPVFTAFGKGCSGRIVKKG
ncbi:MAG: molybdopterin-dependent oxidoreductase [bacterium]|nr:molybdopterin-dependent oxidoreductase [bacterium]